MSKTDATEIISAQNKLTFLAAKSVGKKIGMLMVCQNNHVKGSIGWVDYQVEIETQMQNFINTLRCVYQDSDDFVNVVLEHVDLVAWKLVEDIEAYK
jgi:L-asparaginase II